MTNAFSRGVLFLLLTAAVTHSQGISRPSFEVASVKPAQPLRFADEVDLFRQMSEAVKIDPAQVRLTNQTLESLITRAYRVKSFQISAPEWISDERYDIVAGIPAGVTTDSVPEMLQSLLEDRLKLKCHLASKEFDVFVLSVREGGLKIPQKPADYKFSATGAWPQTMEYLANQLMQGTGRPVMDKTGLPGQYMIPPDFRDMVIKASAARAWARRFPESAATERAPAAGDIRLSIQSLGLSLEPGKQSFPLLVVDHAEKTPTEN